MSLRFQALTIDSHDPKKLASFWAEVLGWRVTYEDEEEVVIQPQEGSAGRGVCPELSFFLVPDRKTTKNRLHLDLRPDDQATEVARALSLGAVRADVGQDGSEPWVVLADPEGNEFCVLSAPTPGPQAGSRPPSTP